MRRTFIDAAMNIAEDDQTAFVVVSWEERWVELLDLCDDWQRVVVFVLSEGFDSIGSIDMLGLGSEKSIPDYGEYCNDAEYDDGDCV